MEYQHFQNKKIKMEYLDIPKLNITSWTLINFFFVRPSIAEMMIGVMMKVM
jgi:hypothetical protein